MKIISNEDLNNKELQSLEIAVLYSKIPSAIKKEIVTPYISVDKDEARISVRIKDSLEDLRRNDLIQKIDKDLIKEIKIFDVYEGENIPSDKKSIALKVTIQSDHKTLDENDLSNISKKIVSTVEEKTGAKLRS